MSETFGREYNVIETECCRKGADSCKLSATLAGVRESPGIGAGGTESD